MADIARVMGVSSGSLYNYVESKEALFFLVIDRGFTIPPSREPPSLPVRTPPPGALSKRILERFRTEGTIYSLAAALKLPCAEEPSAELEAIVREFYEITYRTAHLTAMLDRSAHDMPELAGLFYGKMRGGLVSRLTRLIESRIAAGQYRSVAHPAVAARLIIETVGYFARNRRGDPASEDISDEAAEETTVDFVVNSLLAKRRSQTRMTRTVKPLASPVGDNRPHRGQVDQ